MSGREWVEIRGWGRPGYDQPGGWIPRDVLESLGVDCSPLDRLVVGITGRQQQGTVFIPAEVSAAIRRHSEWEPESPRVVPPASGGRP